MPVQRPWQGIIQQPYKAPGGQEREPEGVEWNDPNGALYDRSKVPMDPDWSWPVYWPEDDVSRTPTVTTPTTTTINQPVDISTLGPNQNPLDYGLNPTAGYHWEYKYHTTQVPIYMTDPTTGERYIYSYEPSTVGGWEQIWGAEEVDKGEMDQYQQSLIDLQNQQFQWQKDQASASAAAEQRQREQEQQRWQAELDARRQELLVDLQTSPRKWITYEMLARGQMPGMPDWLAPIAGTEAGEPVPVTPELQAAADQWQAGQVPTVPVNPQFTSGGSPIWNRAGDAGTVSVDQPEPPVPTPFQASTWGNWSPDQQQMWMGYMDYLGINPDTYRNWLQQLWALGGYSGQAQWMQAGTR